MSADMQFALLTLIRMRVRKRLKWSRCKSRPQKKIRNWQSAKRKSTTNLLKWNHWSRRQKRFTLMQYRLQICYSRTIESLSTILQFYILFYINYFLFTIYVFIKKPRAYLDFCAYTTQAVGSIKTETLGEIRSLRAPPVVIRDILEGVLTIMGIFDTSWVSMKRFIPSIR